jgi:hypothetical protein
VADHRQLGISGWKVSEMTYGNWLGHAHDRGRPGPGLPARRPHDPGNSTFKTVIVYANTQAESALGEALATQQHDSSQTYLAVRPAHQGRGVSRGQIPALDRPLAPADSNRLVYVPSGDHVCLTRSCMPGRVKPIRAVARTPVP